jgi:FkbM family methyltransferase
MSNQSSSYTPSEEEKLIWQFFNNRKEGFFIEIGANHPVNLSQTYFLEKNGWDGILIEPQQNMADLLRHHRKAKVYEVACGAPAERGTVELFVAGEFSSIERHAVFTDIEYSKTVTVTLVTIDDIHKQEGYPQVDFLSIDTEGTELNVLQGLDFSKLKPNLILIEYHVLSLDIHWFFLKHRYKLIRRTGVNNWYIPKDVNFLMPFSDKMKLFRKMYLGTPLRKLQWVMKKYIKHRKFRYM